MKKNKVIGVLGGMGPQATVDFYRRLISLAQKEFDARNGKDFPFILIFNISPPDIISGKNRRILPFLEEGVKRLEEGEADFIVIPCNTVHVFINELKKTVTIPILSLIEETIRSVRNKGLKRVGILGTKTTIKEEIYQEKLEKFKIKSIVPGKADLRQLVEIISRVIAGERKEEDKDFILALINKMVNQGAQGIILGCTEIPLIIKQEDVNVPIFDTLEILAKVCLMRYYK